VLQNIIEEDEIKLDWFFIVSLINDIVNVSGVSNLPVFSAVKEYWISVKNWQSYRHEFGVLLFWDTVYIHKEDLHNAKNQ